MKAECGNDGHPYNAVKASGEIRPVAAVVESDQEGHSLAGPTPL
jgi:hypothetical protein